MSPQQEDSIRQLHRRFISSSSSPLLSTQSNSSNPTDSSKSNDQSDEPILILSEEIPAKWSVLPQVRGRSVATNRLWVNRYLARKESARVAAAATGEAATGAEILERLMTDSLVEEYLPFKSDPSVREDYVNAYGSIRIGKILEDLDALAGSIAYVHCDDFRDDTPPLTIVTASLDRIDMINRIPVNEDVCMSGMVTCTLMNVGTSSMEISITMETVPDGAPREVLEGKYVSGPTAKSDRKHGTPILAAKFTMVARDPVTGKAAAVNQLKLETDEERRLYRLGAEAKARKQVAAHTSLAKRPPSSEEMILVHDLYLEYIKYLDPSYQVRQPENVVWMKDTIRQTLVMCQPQDRNIHNNIFGGYLMRLAYELSYSTALLFTHSRVYFVALDDILFRKPVPIGRLLSLTAQVVYAAGWPSTSFQVKVRADVVDPVKRTSDLSNEFTFTFVAPGETKVPRVMPRSYDESMRYLDGKRRKDAWLQASRHNTALFGADRLKSWFD
ncbi:Acyl-coenzyme A thioesterase 9, mitochondrial [Blyttiomyces sp. JEL0837]|nr:Acyl-coenzyme A thioesterase 9, mitochondrial [Blyttiomyces sp. JEL0837]